MGRYFVFVFLLFLSHPILAQTLSTSLLNQVPRSYTNYAGIKNKSSTCKNLLEPTRNYLLQLKKQGHHLALMMNTGSRQPMGPLQLRDNYMGQHFQRSEDLIEFLEDRALKAGVTVNKEREDLIKKCFRGRKLTPSESRVLPEACTQANQSRFLHSGFVFLSPQSSREPFVIHMYGDERYNYSRASIRVESLDSYLKESGLSICESKVIQIKKSAQNKIKKFFELNFPTRLLATGKNSYNFVTHPWGIISQNCNAWASEVLAASLFLEPHQWATVDRKQSKIRLWQTGFTPTKLPMTNLQALVRLPSLFIGGINMEEGNIIHQPYVVADILPSQTIVNWLNRQGLITREKIIYGQ